jgi:hypothetical protein
LSARAPRQAECFRSRGGHSIDPLMAAAGDFLRARDLWSTASWSDATLIIDRALADIGDDDTPDGLQVSEFGHLRAAITSARATRPADAWDRHRIAGETIGRLDGAHHDRYRLTSTPANVAIHGVAVAVELHDGREAVDLGKDLRLPADLPPYRAGHHYMDLARGWLWFGDRDAALATMEKAERIAPMLVRNHPMGRQAVRSMLEQESRLYKERLRRLASRMNVL